MESKLHRSRWKSLTSFIIVFGFAVLCSVLFVLSFTTNVAYYLFGYQLTYNCCDGNPRTRWDTLMTFVPLITAIVSAGGTISSGILAWRISRRDARERDLKIEKLELELKTLKQGETSPPN
jgi:hypothetical protein